LLHGHVGSFKNFNLVIRQQCEEHRKSPDRVLLEAIRRQDPELYDWIINARKQGRKINA
jgi:hypothetical protein